MSQPEQDLCFACQSSHGVSGGVPVQRGSGVSVPSACFHLVSEGEHFNGNSLLRGRACVMAFNPHSMNSAELKLNTEGSQK